MVEAKSNLLVVEDDVDVAEMLEAYFRVQGYEACAINWGEPAIDYALKNHPDLIILDIRLPDIDGFEVARRLRSNRRTADIPIIFLTEKRTRTARLEGLELGADDYITKPFDIQELRLRVRNSLKRVTEGSLTNPVTNLPEGRLVDERLAECIENPNHGFLRVELQHLDAFRDTYGFVVSDDMQRAVSLMIRNILRESDSQDNFIGQINQTTFIIVTSLPNLPLLAERISSRLEQALDYFYPLKDRQQENSPTRLAIKLRTFDSVKMTFNTVQDLKAQMSLTQG